MKTEEDAATVIVDWMPAGLRNYYLDRLLSERDESCWKCGVRLSGALEAIQNDLLTRNNSYKFDYTRLLPFIGADSKFGEPVPEIACYTILLSRSNRVYLALIRAYRNSIDTLSGCAWAGLDGVRQNWPALYPDVKRKLWRDLRSTGLGAARDSWGNKLLSDYDCPYIPNHAGCPKEAR